MQYITWTDILCRGSKPFACHFVDNLLEDTTGKKGFQFCNPLNQQLFMNLSRFL